ncbi:phage tail protein [Antrihabitans cavernicola]|uniref:Phage tail protein n=1 Tax=Antrihabitans cavernicola TaxID=2495913 RepID=A0A5A7S5F2_9NOCA|nr:phage tail protein [Spelaeibacter cavernicola]KAA0016749.1 phage tail protein [Spelaeibacter cavernicola]
MPEMLIEVEGHNGDVITIHGKGKGSQGAVLGEHPEGIYDEPTESIWNSHAFQTGADFGGIRVNKRDVVLGMEFVPQPGLGLADSMSRFRQAWSYKADSKLWIETPDTRRHVPLRISETLKCAPDVDVFVQEHAHVIYSLTAGKPRWLEPDVTKKWKSTTDTTDGSTAVGYVPVSNPTAQNMWLKWTVQAYPGAVYKLADYSFGDDRYERAEEDATRMVPLPSLIAGEHLVVNTDEEEDQVTSSLDTQVWMRMEGRTFCYPVPPNTKKTMLRVEVTGAPAGVGVQVRCPREYAHPFLMES